MLLLDAVTSHVVESPKLKGLVSAFVIDFLLKLVLLVVERL